MERKTGQDSRSCAFLGGKKQGSKSYSPRAKGVGDEGFWATSIVRCGELYVSSNDYLLIGRFGSMRSPIWLRCSGFIAKGLATSNERDRYVVRGYISY